MATKYRFILRSRPRSDDPVTGCHDRIMSQLTQLPPPWRVICQPWPKASEPDDVLIVIKLNNCFDKGISLTASYRDRKMLRDKASGDDIFIFEFDSQKIEWDPLLRTVFPQCVESVRAYYAQLMSYDYAIVEADGRRKVNDRTGIYSITPVNFFDRQLCHNAF